MNDVDKAKLKYEHATLHYKSLKSLREDLDVDLKRSVYDMDSAQSDYHEAYYNNLTPSDQMEFVLHYNPFQSRFMQQKLSELLKKYGCMSSSNVEQTNQILPMFFCSAFNSGEILLTLDLLEELTPYDLNNKYGFTYPAHRQYGTAIQVMGSQGMLYLIRYFNDPNSGYCLRDASGDVRIDDIDAPDLPKLLRECNNR